MNQKTSWIARAFAIIALIAAVVIVFSVVTGASEDDSAKKSNPVGKTNKQAGKNKKKIKIYKVKPDDTLTGIAAANGISVERIEALNPDLDPQALQAGARLKLR